MPNLKQSVPHDHPSITALRATPIVVPKIYVDAATDCGDPIVADLQTIANDALAAFQSHQEAGSAYDLLVRDPETGVLALVGIDISHHSDPDVGSGRRDHGSIAELCTILSGYSEADPAVLDLVEAMSDSPWVDLPSDAAVVA